MHRSSTRSRSRKNSSTRYNRLENRHLLAGVYLDTSIDTLYVFGDAGDNVGEVSMVFGSVVRAEIDGMVQDHNILSVADIQFIGFAGNDTFTNNTTITSSFFGHGGSDTLNGGGANDTLNGGPGTDIIRGNDGNDILIGVSGDDQLYGGDGDDSLFAGNGLTTVEGNDGDDVIYGGDFADNIKGGEGADSIYALGGDDIIDAGNGGVAFSSGSSRADLVLGLGGNDTITGGDGLNIFWGGDGDDILTGGSGENRIHGQGDNDELHGGDLQDYLSGGEGIDSITGYAGNDYIFGYEGSDTIDGGAGDDYIDGGSGADNIDGNAGNDLIRGDTGNDSIDGGADQDVVLYDTVESNYSVTGEIGDLIIEDKHQVYGTDEVDNFETIRYADGDQEAKPNAAQVVYVQPIIVSNDDGSDTAAFFGNASQEADIKQTIDEIFAQASVDVEWLLPNTWNNSFANTGNSSTRPEGDLSTIVDDGDSVGVGNTNPLVLDMYFVEVVPGFSDTSENTANGLAYVDFNGIGMHVGDNLLSFSSGRDVVARVAAHEIAHNLSLEHVQDPDNLMADGTELTDQQVQDILDSRYTQII
ncbi:MAG: hypothetical protein AAF939_01100 [Planctomycetota bacterium]